MDIENNITVMKRMFSLHIFQTILIKQIERIHGVLVNNKFVYSGHPKILRDINYFVKMSVSARVR